MGSNANYAIVGLFVLLFTAGVLGFAYWLAKHGGQQEYDYYQVFMTESVAGLSTDASVKYRGVEVGTVSEMDLNPDNPEEVRLVLKIRRGTPVKADTRATLKFYGITGLAFIELQGTSRDAPRLEPRDGEMPVIPTTPSTFTRLDDALSELAVKSTRALDRIDRLLSDDNLKAVATLLKDTRDMVHGVRRVAEGLNRQMEDLRTLIHKGIEMEENVSSAFEDVTEASLDVARLSEALQETYVALGEEAKQLVAHGSEMTQALFEDLDLLLEELRVTVETLRNSPGDLIFTRSMPRPGPGEERVQ
jgi:ABC-type transport system involved in resistance to organic solvents, periplasmic component